MQPYLQYIVLLGAVVIVGAFVMPRKKQEPALPSQTMQNMETALEQFMENMEKDNEELVQLVRGAQQETKVDAERQEQRIAELERKCEQLAEQLQMTRSASAAMALQTASPQPLSIDTAISEAEIAKLPEPVEEEAPRENTIHSRYADLFALYEQGKSIEMISKKLGMNKGEVQLIIQLAKQEEAAHA
jgi:DNA uptake protein ComE-like DNA-binding protein